MILTKAIKVAMLSPISWSTPPKHYGPWEFVASLLSEELVKLGYDVTLYATENSKTKAKLKSVIHTGYSEDPDLNRKVCECLHISDLFENADNFDIIHNHFDYLPLTYSRLVDTPVLTTIHGFSSDSILQVYRKYATNPFVSISYASRISDLNYVANVYHGINIDNYEFSDSPGEYLLSLGRISPQKGIHLAIDVARNARRPLIIAGIIDDVEYFQQKVQPFVDGSTVSYVGPVASQKKARLLAEAFASVHLCTIPEPFGLSIIESLASGTPVVAMRKGAIPEILSEETGIIVSNPDEALEAVDQVHNIDRHVCREAAEKRFTSQRMAKEYAEIYAKVLETNRV
jgi:glycosyltransferase involved in cell wall biosynthesis